jgi:hypothetical protein
MALTFHETQSIRPRRMRWLVAFPPALITSLATAQWWFGHPIGPHALSERSLASTAALLWIVYVLLLRVRLVTDVSGSAISIRLRGLGRRHEIPVTAILSASVIAFDPDTDFGGYGFREVPSGRAYVADAARGVRLELENGGFAVIGSTRPEELRRSILSNLGPTRG